MSVLPARFGQRIVTAAVACAIAFVFTLVSRADGVADSPTDASRLAQAASAYDAGVSRMGTDRAGATAKFQEAAAVWTSLIEERGVESGALWYNVGNARLLSGEPGRAVLAYRRAERLMPFDGNLAANLSVARERAGAAVPTPPQPGAMQGVVEAARFVPAHLRLVIGVSLLGLAWGLALGRLMMGDGERLRPRRWMVGGAAACGVLVVATLALETIVERAEPRGVVTAAAGAPTRTGPSEAVHDAASPAVLPAGTEFVLVQRQVAPAGGGDGWAQVRLGTGGEVWVRADRIEMVGPG